MEGLVEIEIPRLRHPLLKGDGAPSSFSKEVPRNEAEDLLGTSYISLFSASLRETSK
jgi:NurA-like 5'-3' nuclease